MAYDIKITGGTIVDGTGRPRYVGDVGIADGRIAALGEAPDRAKRTIEGSGLISSGYRLARYQTTASISSSESMSALRT